MKIRGVIAFGIVLLALGSFAFWQSHRLTVQKGKVASLQNEVNEKAQQLEDAQSSKKWLMAQRAELMSQATNTASSNNLAQTEKSNPTGFPSALAALGGKADGTNASLEKGAFGKFISKMMQDPETKQFMRQQQQIMMGQLYTPLVKTMGLSPEEADKFKSMLVDNAMKATEHASTLLNAPEGSNPADRTQSAMTMAADQKAFEDQLMEFLGDTRYAQYKDYQTTVGDRLQLNLFRQQAGFGDHALTDDQTEQLLRMMRDERQGLTAAGYGVIGAPGQDFASTGGLPSPDQVDKLIEGQEYVNERVQERAKTLLSPEQLDALARFQTNQLQTLRMGMTMARKMMQ